MVRCQNRSLAVRDTMVWGDRRSTRAREGVSWGLSRAGENIFLWARFVSFYGAVILFEDEHLLVVNKPPGWNTHAPNPYAGEGVYDWLRHREPRWASLSILHRLDKETSGLLVFGKTSTANRSLTEQFAQHHVSKRYVLLTDRPVSPPEFTVTSSVVRCGDRYVSRPLAVGGVRAETRFRLVKTEAGRSEVLAEPVTGRTHQIRVHAASHGLPVLGDALYGGSPARRLCLHAAELSFQHPASGEALTFRAPVDFFSSSDACRAAVIDPQATDAFRLLHGDADGCPGWYVDRLGDSLLSQSDTPVTESQVARLRELADSLPASAAATPPPVAGRPALSIYHKLLNRQVRKAGTQEASPRLVCGPAAPGRFLVRENGVRFELSFEEGYSVGLFLDQRDNRRRFLTQHVAAGFPLFPEGAAGREVLNTFAYTCGFSVCAARAGARVTSLDLSRKYLEWGRRNFVLNGLEPAAHDFIYGDAFEWLKRLGRKGRRFDALVLDPPTFSQSSPHGVFQADRDYGKLVAAALPLLKPAGVLLASSNTARWAPEDFVETLLSAVAAAGRQVLRRHYVPQPPDFPISRAEPAYLKTLWLRLA